MIVDEPVQVAKEIFEVIMDIPQEGAFRTDREAESRCAREARSRK